MSTEFNYIGTLRGHNGHVTSIVVGKDKDGTPLVVSGSRDKKLIVWKLNLDTPVAIVNEDGKKSEESLVGKPFKALSGHSHFISSLALSKDSNFVVSASWDKTLRLWDLNTFKMKALMTGHTKDVLCVSFSVDSRLIISGSMDRTLKYWNVKGELKHNFPDFNGWVSCLTHVKQEKQNLIAVGSWDQQVRFYDSDKGYLASVSGFDYGVVSTATDENGEFLFSAEKNGKVQAHKLSGTSSEWKRAIDLNYDINAISFETKYFSLIIAATSRGLIVAEVKSGNVLFEKTYCACHSLAWDESRTLLFAGFADGAIRVFRFKGEN
jgi:guanine nucleotide-binding protein subunit beta-2-like 1 protein